MDKWSHSAALFLSCINVLFSTEPILVELCLKTTFYEKQRQVIIPTTKYFLFDAKIITSRKNTDRLNEWMSVVLPWQAGLLLTVTDVSKTCEG